MKKFTFFLLLTLSGASFAQNIRYVKEGGSGNKDGSSWSNASDDLQLMINQATATSQIWVAAGTYKPNRPANNLNTISLNNRENAFVLKDGVKLYGGFTGTETSLGQRNYEVNKSILSGDLGTINNTNDNAYHVIISVSAGDQTVFDGFTVTKGNANGSQNGLITINGQSFAQSRGGGICNGLSSLIISNCTFTENMATVGGAVWNQSSPVNISNSIFLSNTATMNCGGVFNSSSSNAIITNCNFIKNTASAWGGAMLNDISSPTITACTFSENVAGNRGGAIHNENSASKIYSSLFIKNTGSNLGGGAIWHNYGNMSIINCTIYGNTSANNSYAGGVHANNGKILLYNSLLWNNQSQQYTGLSYITFNNNLIQGYTNTMNGNVNANGITTEQIFVNAPNNDFQLKTGSPAIAKGSNSLYSSTGGNLANDKDLAGNSRLRGINIDIGTYESLLLPQTITAVDITKTYGNITFMPAATASSGLQVGYTSADNNIAEAFQDNADGNRWKIRIKKAGEVNITAKQAGDDTYGPASDVTFKLTIKKASLAVTANTKNKVYGATDPDLTYTVSGLANGDTQSIFTGSLARTVGEAAGTYSIEQGTLAANDNYDIAYTPADFNITKAVLNITANTKTKTYGTTDPVLTYTINGLTNGDTGTIITGALARTEGENVGTYTIEQGTLSAGNNYTATYVGANFNITKATLSIVANSKSKVYGTADPTLSYTVNGLANGDTESSITGSLSRAVGENIGTYAIGQGTLTASGNYDVAYTAADFSITKATLNIVADAKSKVYGTADPDLTYTITGLANGDTESIITGALARAAGENIGTYAIEKGTLAVNGNYDVAFTGADFSITKATLNIVADAKSKVYGTADSALTYNVTGLANGDTESSITGDLTRAAGENIGTYAIEQGTLAATGNYDFNYTGADFNITKATLNIVADTKSKVYGTIDPALTYTVTGLVNGDTESSITGDLARVAGENIGTYAIEQGTLAATGNYDFNYTGADFNITKATLNIVADAKSKVYGTADPALTYTVTGLVNGDTESSITGDLARVAGENIGTYAIEQGTLAATGNYDVAYTGADFNITKATLNIVADAKSKVYGTADPALTYTVTGLANEDTENIITGALARATGENIGTYAIEKGTLAVSGNYDVAYTGADFSITKATLNIVADAKSKVYGTADPALTYTVTGLANGDDQTIITGNLTRTTGENIGTYAIEQGTLAVNGNYDVAFTSADFNITKATLNIVADAKSKVYGTADPILTYTVTGLSNGDDQTIITGNLTRATGENIGTYAIEQGTLTVNGNYDVAYTGADFNITKATLNIVADAKSKVYGTADPALTYTITGLVNGDTESVITGALVRATGENIGTYAIGQGTLAASGNYDIAFTGADFNITKATLNIVADAKSKVYGTADPALTYTITGLANGDTESIVTGALVRTPGENIGSYAIGQGTLAVSGNYDVAYTGAYFNITKATLNIVADAKSKTYGTADPALTYTLTGLANGDTESIISGALVRAAGENIGTYAIDQGTLAVSGNYDVAYTGADFNITKATLNIVVDTKSKVYGTTDPDLTYTVTGLANGDTESIISGALARATGENIGTYAIDLGTLAVSGNYDIAYTGADFNITKATLNIVADAKSKVYGTADPDLTYIVTGLANGDTESIISGALVRAIGENIGTYAIEQGTLAVSGNYDIAYTGADFSITKATLNIVADAKSKVYGMADPTLTYTVSGLANGDTETILTGTLTRTSGEDIGTYTIEQGTLAVSGNYDVAFTGADFNITKAVLNIVADAKSKVYGTADPDLTYTVTGLANGDTESIISGALVRAIGENIGTYAIEKGTLAVSGNYDIAYTGADFNITKATLNIVADAKSKVYGTADPDLTYTVSGLANGDDQTIITGALVRAVGENIGTYTIEQGTLAASGNYDIAYTGANFDITKATLNIIADAKSKAYGTADPALTYTATGFANGDTNAIITGSLIRTAGEAVGTYPIAQGTLTAGNNYDILYTGADFTIIETLIIADFSQTNVTCYGGSDGSATVSISGGAAPYTYLWSPNGRTAPAASGLTAGTYTVTVTDANGSVITKTFTITQPQAVTPPTAEEVQEFCRTANPTISDLEIQGTQVKWYVSENSTQELPSSTPLVDGTTYYASQTVNGCESPERTLVIVILNDRLPAPEGSATQDFEEGATIADLVVTPANVIWYASYDDAVNNTNPLSPTTQLVDGTTYYAVAIADGQCSSLPLAVTANAALGVGKPQKATFKYYPNPVENYLNIQSSAIIERIEVYSMLGQMVKNQNCHSGEVRLFLGDLPDGTYVVSIMSEGQKSTVKVVKK